MTNKRVAVLPFPGIDNAYVCVSGKLRRQQAYGERWYAQHQEHKCEWADRETRTEPFITFLYDAGSVCAEWDGASGPIQMAFKAVDAKTPLPGASTFDDEPKEHWFYEYATWSGAWSQMAVSENRLADRFSEGDYAGIFAVLRRFAVSRQHELESEAA